MIQILGRPNSVNVQKVMWSAAEIGVPVERHDIGGAFGGNNTEDYLSKNPNGIVPTLVDGDFVLWESNSIVRYLSEAHGSAPWFPTSVEDRAHCSQWLDWYLTTLHAPMTTIFWQLVRTSAEDRDQAALDAAVVNAGKLWAKLDNHLASRSYVTGDALTMGDVAVGCAAYRWHAVDITRPDLPNLKRWWDDLASRDAYQQHVMLPLT